MTYLLAGSIGAFLSFVGLVFAATGGLKFAMTIAALLLAAHVASIIYVVKGSNPENKKWRAIALVMPLPIVYVLMSIFHLGNFAYTTAKPDSEAFLLACKAAGPKYERSPTEPVHSIAFDWDAKISPTFNQFNVTRGTRITSLGRSNPTYRELFDYVERKSYGPDGIPSQGAGQPYNRLPQTGEYYGVPALTADILVHYQISPETELRKAANDQGIVTYFVTVTDRRTSERLASLRYVIDAKSRRGCGLTNKGGLSVNEFVLTSLSLNDQRSQRAL